MKILKQSDITDFFKCPHYPDLKPVPYKLCLGRQLTKLAGGGWQYPECVGCHTGKQITEHFKDYQPVTKKGRQPNWNTDVIMDSNNKKKAALKSQVEMVIDLELILEEL